MLGVAAMMLSVAVPFAIFYLWADPFKVVHRYEKYYEDPVEHPYRIGINKGMVTVNTYQRNLAADSAGYNAFIFGSSISCYYDAREWAALVAGGDSARAMVRPFHFDSAAETPMSMARKVDYLQATGAAIDHALLVLDPIILGASESESPFAIDPPEFRPGLGYLAKYHYAFFRAATNADFFKSYLATNAAGQMRNIGHKPIYDPQPIIYDPAINQESIPEWDSLIAADPARFYAEHQLIAPSDSVTPAPASIAGEKAEAFRRIAAVFKSMGTDCHIIISPNRRGLRLSDADAQTLREIFPEAAIRDFSASHARWLRADTMLYDNTHYRPAFASRLMREAYAPGE